MAKLSQVLRDKKREKMIAKHAAKRAELRAKIKSEDVDPDEKDCLLYTSPSPRD